MIELHGTYDPQFEPVVGELRRQLRQFKGGLSACIYRDGQPILDVWGGAARVDGSPWKRDTMAIGYSATKGVTATALHILASDGLIDYDEPVARYWPEFEQAGKHDITVRQVLSHQAGLHQLGPLLRKASNILDWDTLTHQLAAARPQLNPAGTGAYHAITFGWLVGELIRRVAGKSFQDVLRERLVEPLELDGCFIGCPRNQLDRVADVIGMPPIRRRRKLPFRRRYRVPKWVPPGPFRRLIVRGMHPRQLRRLFRHPDFWTTPIPAMNGVFTARSLAKLFAALANEGELGGVRLMSRETIQKATEVQTTGLDKVVIYPLRWRLGYHRADAMLKSVPEAFGHFGFAGTGVWANPTLRMSAGLIHNAYPLTISGQLRMAQFTGAVYKSMGLYDGLLKTILSGAPTVLHPLPEASGSRL